MMDKGVILRCSHCGNRQTYDRGADPDLPARVAEIVTDDCDKCEAANGGTERWYDADGNEVVQVVPEWVQS